uniref:Tetraspanin n=2 Tax=Loa loa TaxID=7209 RepID=A0A1I7VH85_LOALO
MSEERNGQCAQLCVLLYTVFFWLTGLALIFLSLWTLLDPRRNYVLDLVDFSEDDPLLRAASYLALVTGSVTMIIGFIGCCGAIKKSLCLLITFVICLLVLFFVNITIACLALFYRNKFVGNKLSAYLTKLTHDRYYRLYWVTSLIDIIQYYFLTSDFDQKLQSLIRESYGINPSIGYNARVTSLIDRLQFNEQCCGSVDYRDWSNSRWRTSYWTGVELIQQQLQFGFDIVPNTCCVQLTGATSMNPVARSSARCQQFQANKLWRHQTQQCCGATGPHNYYDSFWYKTNTERGTISFVPQSCCKQMHEARAWFIKPVDTMCTSYNYYTSAFNSSVNTQGCHEKLLGYLTAQTIIFVSVGISFAAFQLIGIYIALSLSQRVHGSSWHYQHINLKAIETTVRSALERGMKAWKKLRFGSMARKSKKNRKKVKKGKSKSAAVAQTLPADLWKRVESRPMSNPNLLWSNSRIENISRTPGGSVNCNETSAEYAKLKECRLSAAYYHCKGDQKFLEQDFHGAYADFLCAMKILGEHGNITDEFGRDMKILRVYQDKCCICFWILYTMERNQSLLTKCFECYDQLIENDPAHAFWYKRRAVLLRDECHNYKLAYKDFVLFTALMKEYRLTVAKEEVSDTIYCFHETVKMAWSLEKEKRAKKPFLTSDWINLWALCPCDDILLEDLLSVREEDRNPLNKSTLVESAYKDALKQTARGYHSMVVDTLRDAYAEGQGIYRSEAFLLLSLIYSQIDDNEVDYYLDTFIVLWEVDQYKVPIPRRKQIFMRYMSLARALSPSPFENLDLSMFSSKEQAQFYTQTALTIILRLQLLGGTLEDRVETNASNLVKLENIENLCDRAIKADRLSLHTGMLREYTVLEIALIDGVNKHSTCTLASLKEYIE